MNFSVYSRDASSIELLLFDREDDLQPARVISLDPFPNRTYHYWHVFVPAVRAGQIYGYRVQGRFDPAAGCALMVPKSCLIHMVAESSFQELTLVRAHSDPEITAQLQ